MQSMDEESNTATQVILSLETKSVQPYKTQDEYLYAMKEDLAEWFNTLYGVEITVENFFEQLETGVVLCQHANNVQSFILERLIEEKNGVFVGKRPLPKARDFIGRLPEKGVSYRSSVRLGSFQARDNISNFITWCRGLGIDDVLMFETDDLVLRKNERSVVLCLLEVARRGAKYGMLAPKLIQLEEEIDAEIAGEEPLNPPVQRITCDLMSLDEMVREMVSLCTCPDQFPVVRISEGKYQVGDSKSLIFVRILRNHVMVRIGGGWDTLQNYLNRHDPCRCSSKGHKVTGARANTGNINTPSGTKRRSSAAVVERADPRSARAFTPEPQSSQFLPQSRSKRSHSVHPGSVSFDSTEVLGSHSTHSLGHTRPKSAQKAVNKSFDETRDRNRRTTTTARSVTPNAETTSPRNCSVLTPHREITSPISLNESGRKSSLVITEFQRPGGAVEHLDGVKTLSVTKVSSSHAPNGFVTPKRPASARERGSVTPGPYHSQPRSRSRDRTMSEGGDDSVKSSRSKSLGAAELSRQLQNRRLPFGTPNGKKAPEVLMVSRDSSGLHSVEPMTNGTHGRNGNYNTRPGDEFKRPMTPRVQISPDRILPDKPKLLRSASAESSDSSSNGTSNGNGAIPKTLGQTPITPVGVPRASRSLSFSSVPDDDDGLEPPPENRALNEKMERLFQEYLKLELGSNGEDAKYTFAPISRSRKASGSSEGSESISSYNSYSTKSGSSFQKSCSSSREEILGSTSTSGRSSPALVNGSPKKAPYGHHASNSKHSTTTPGERNVPGTPRSVRKATGPREDVNANRPSTPVGRRSGSLTRNGGSRPSSAAGNRNTVQSQGRKAIVNGETADKSRSSNSSAVKSTPKARALSREDLVDGHQPGERGRPASRTGPPERGSTPTRAESMRERGRTPTRGSNAPQDTDGQRGRTSTRRNESQERGRTPTRPSAHERGRTPTRNNNVHERGRTPTGRDSDRTQPGAGARSQGAPVRARSRSRDLLNSERGTLRTAAAVKSVSTPTATTPRTHRKLPATPVVQSNNSRVKPNTPARPASARANPYPHQRGSREDLLTSTRSRERPVSKPSTPARPASARANPYQPRSKSREDLLDGDSSYERGRTRAVTNSSRQRSASTTSTHRNPLTLSQAPVCPPGEHTFSRLLDLDLTYIESRLTPKPRKDEKPGRTKIPMPNNQAFANSTPLKRFDSGVDIATISPTESSTHADELWQHDLLYAKMTNGGATYNQVTPNNVSYAQPNGTFNCIDDDDDDDDSEYF